MSAVPGTLVFMYSLARRNEAIRLLADGLTLSQVSRLTGISRATMRAWLQRSAPAAPVAACPRCDGLEVDGPAYSALLGFYLGDGCVSRMPRYFTLRVSCDATYPKIIDDVGRCIAAVRPGGTVHHVAAALCLVVQSGWQHWPCLFPQHGPGRKHERPMVLEGWQRELVQTHPGAFLCGLFHSDGSRSRNWARRVVSGEMKRYEYPRWQFTNVSTDIRELCCWALDLADIPWRRSNWNVISVSTRAGVARLDDLIGLKQ